MSKLEKTLPGGSEWSLTPRYWLAVRLGDGIAYGYCEGMKKELPVGGVVIVPPGGPVQVLASTLGPAKFQGFGLRVDSLSGFLTANERRWLETQAPRRCSPYLLLEPTHPLAVRLGEMCQKDKPITLQVRLAFLLEFIELLAPELAKAVGSDDQGQPDPKKRLKDLINQMPESELVDLRLGQLAEHLHCCERHATRLFREVCGCSFRTYISELRLKRACSLLAQGKQKIIDVALESGHSSLALFNHTFKKRFRMTPTQWRQRHMPHKRQPSKPPFPKLAATTE